MNFDKYTIKTQEIIQQAATIAQGNQQQSIETGHILKAMLDDDPNTMGFIAKKNNVSIEALNQKLEGIINAYPHVNNADNQQVFVSNELNAAFIKSQNYLKEFGDEFISVEILFMALVAGSDVVARSFLD
jgi:ATP-dependent Clp protease ATP-binding subunit ClpB